MSERIGLYLFCEGLGDCIYAIPVIKKIRAEHGEFYRLDIFTHHPGLFTECPYVDASYPIGDGAALSIYASLHRVIKLFEPEKLSHWSMDTYDFISIPLGLGTLSFAEKQLEYFPQEEDKASHFDVVINTSITWPCRSWALHNWQRLADVLLARGLSVAVVGKDYFSKVDEMLKKSEPLNGCVNFVNKLSLDRTFFTIAKCGVFVTCQNGLSVLAGASDAEVVILDKSINWSKWAVYRKESPFYKVEYVKGACSVYCCATHECPLPENNGVFKCQPGYSEVESAVLKKLGVS